MISLGADCSEPFTSLDDEPHSWWVMHAFSHFAWRDFNNKPTCALENLVPIAKILVKHGAHLRHAPHGELYTSPLCGAVHHRHWALVDYMCDLGAHLFDWGVSPIQVTPTVERIQSFIDLGYDINALDPRGRLLVETALNHYRFEEIDLDPVYFLIDNMKDINQENRLGWTVYEYLILTGEEYHWDLELFVPRMIARGADTTGIPRVIMLHRYNWPIR